MHEINIFSDKIKKSIVRYENPVGAFDADTDDHCYIFGGILQAKEFGVRPSPGYRQAAVSRISWGLTKSMSACTMAA